MMSTLKARAFIKPTINQCRVHATGLRAVPDINVPGIYPVDWFVMP